MTDDEALDLRARAAADDRDAVDQLVDLAGERGDTVSRPIAALCLRPSGESASASRASWAASAVGAEAKRRRGGIY